MTLRNTAVSYGSITKFFHWLVFVLLLIMFIVGYLLDDVPKPYQGMVYNLHKLTGLTILFLMILRALWALSNPKPLLPMDTTWWEKAAERSVHILLYIFVMAMPMAGWIGSVAADRAPHIGNFKLTLPIAPDKALSEAAFNLHGLFALIILGLVAIHVSAALYHHFIRKDNVLLRMMPGK
jgi:cytochrome b561